MIRYHDFTRLSDAQAFLDQLTANGGRGLLLTMNDQWHQVREIL